MFRDMEISREMMSSFKEVVEREREREREREV